MNKRWTGLEVGLRHPLFQSVMNLLITGCAGFIGARTSALALESGYEVVGLDNLNGYYDVELKRHRIKPLRNHDGFHFHEIDIEDGCALDRIFSAYEFDAVINLAARAGVRASLLDPHAYMHTNTVATLNLLERMVGNGISKFVMASTSSLYAGHPTPFAEDADVTKPISPYAATKLAAESLCHVWHRIYGLDISVLRYFTVYGPAGRPDMAPFRFCEWIRREAPITLYGNGSQTRDFTYIDDIAKGTMASLGISGYEVINLGGGYPSLRIDALISLLEREFKKVARVEKQSFNETDMRDTSADITKARSLLGWEPQVSPEEGLRRTASWHKENALLLDGIRL